MRRARPPRTSRRSSRRARAGTRRRPSPSRTRSRSRSRPRARRRARAARSRPRRDTRRRPRRSRRPPRTASAAPPRVLRRRLELGRRVQIAAALERARGARRARPSRAGAARGSCSRPSPVPARSSSLIARGMSPSRYAVTAAGEPVNSHSCGFARSMASSDVVERADLEAPLEQPIAVSDEERVLALLQVEEDRALVRVAQRRRNAAQRDRGRPGRLVAAGDVDLDRPSPWDAGRT